MRMQPMPRFPSALRLLLDGGVEPSGLRDALPLIDERIEELQ
jgi:hypothetical protein